VLRVLAVLGLMPR